MTPSCYSRSYSYYSYFPCCHYCHSILSVHPPKAPQSGMYHAIGSPHHTFGFVFGEKVKVKVKVKSHTVIEKYMERSIHVHIRREV